jgi:eukaryotic-like serine/threonine-protein kinase
LVGMQLDAALMVLQQADFVCGPDHITHVCSEAGVPAGQVISQSQTAGTVTQPGTTIKLVVASAGPCAVLPDVVGMAQPEAEEAILANGFVVGAVTEQCSNTFAAGLIMGQDPAGGPAALGTPVNLTISNGPCPEPIVPNCIGLSEAEATAEILAQGLTVGYLSRRCSDRPAGEVIGQSPSPGTITTPGTPVNLIISSGACQRRWRF